MSSDNSVCKYDCGKLSSSMNDTNWSRHINSCKVRKFERNSHSIKSFFSENENKISKSIHQITDAKDDITLLNPLLLIWNIESELGMISLLNIKLVLNEYMFLALVDVNYDLIEDQIIPVINESMGDCEFQKHTEISSCLQNKEKIVNVLQSNKIVGTDELITNSATILGSSEKTLITENTDLSDNNDLTDNLDVLSNDPSTFCMLPSLPQEIIEFFIKKGPMQPTQFDWPHNQSFPKDKYGRSFQSAWYWKSLPGNIQVRRDWLCYSIKDDSAFCLHCIIFGKNLNQSWRKIGFKTWTRAISSIQHHECSDRHIEASLKFKLRKSSLSVIPLLREKLNQEKATYREITSTKKPEINYSSKLRQNQLISSIALNIKFNIQKDLKISKFFSISVDSIFDLSRREQISFIIKYIDNNGDIFERLLALKYSAITTGAQLFKTFEENMRGETNGLQHLVKNKCPTATFIWCSAHRLNLVLNKAVSCNNDAIDLFGNLELVYNFITGSKKRFTVYEDFQSKYSNTGQKRRLKRVSTTRWMSQDYALQAILDTFDSVIYTLEQTRDTEVLDFFAAIHSISNALLKINNLRQKDEVFESLMTKVYDLISDKGEFIFSDLLDKRIRIKQKMPGEKNQVIALWFALIDEIKENPDSLPEDSFLTFCNIYSNFLNQDNLKNEYIQFCNIYSSFEETIQLPIYLHSEINSSLVLEWEEEEHSEEEGDEEDEEEEEKVEVIKNKRKEELLPSRKKVTNVDSIKTVYKIFQVNLLATIFSLIDRALKIILTLPVASASTESSFSKLKIIKNRLRTSISQDKLEDLMIISYEKDIFKKKDFLTKQTSEGLRVTLYSTIDLTKYLLDSCGFDYILPGKMCQDPLEKFFGIIRQSAGPNDHPTTPTFLHLYKLLSVYSILRPPKYDNCTVNETDIFLENGNSHHPAAELVTFKSRGQLKHPNKYLFEFLNRVEDSFALHCSDFDVFEKVINEITENLNF
ncbi:hypothetical protein AGLY_017320 [Aphis glycines]|uniref:TTF-type domain-containing protein n=1 Tax=Aphis glycines TaxID=307491 RepID=A0A6G0SX92_APHGL|nr:hypothetical protein AGLY_017320 [Aphis glycines]